MYQFSYAEIMEDGVADAKDRERQALTRSIELLTLARDEKGYSREAIEALFYTRRVWIRLIEDLKQPENQLDAELRANLISIAIWILKECDRIRKRQSTNFQGIIDVTTIKSDKVVFGATVKLNDVEKGTTVTYQIVGNNEADTQKGKVSYTSPLGKALIGKEAGDTVLVRAPKGDIEYEIESFEFKKN